MEALIVVLAIFGPVVGLSILLWGTDGLVTLFYRLRRWRARRRLRKAKDELMKAMERAVFPELGR